MPMAQYLLLRVWLVLLTTSVRCGLPIFLKVNHQLESRMQEICQSGSEGGAKLTFVPTPISAQASMKPNLSSTRCEKAFFQGLWFIWSEIRQEIGCDRLWCLIGTVRGTSTVMINNQ